MNSLADTVTGVVCSQGECVRCGEDGSRCARMGLHADRWQGDNMTQVKMYLSTGPGPHYCRECRLCLALSPTTCWDTQH